MITNYALYVKEREGKDILESKEGFATYYFDHDSVYVADVFVRPEFRKQNIAKNFVLEIMKLGKEKGMKECVTFIDTSTKGYEISKSGLLANDFEVIGFNNNMVFFKRNL